MAAHESTSTNAFDQIRSHHIRSEKAEKRRKGKGQRRNNGNCLDLFLLFCSLLFIHQSSPCLYDNTHIYLPFTYSHTPYNTCNYSSNILSIHPIAAFLVFFRHASLRSKTSVLAYSHPNLHCLDSNSSQCPPGPTLFLPFSLHCNLITFFTSFSSYPLGRLHSLDTYFIPSPRTLSLLFPSSLSLSISVSNSISISHIRSIPFQSVPISTLQLGAWINGLLHSQ